MALTVTPLQLALSVHAPPSSAGSPSFRGNSSMGDQSFDPLSHHRSWCPWVFTGTGPRESTHHEAEGPRTHVKCGWMHLLEGLNTPRQPATAAAGATTPTPAAASAGQTPVGAGQTSVNAGQSMDVDMEEPGEGGERKDMASIKQGILAALRHM